MQQRFHFISGIAICFAVAALSVLVERVIPGELLGASIIALFMVRSVENLVKKYAKTVTTMKNITPHKLRSTYGTNLYNETGDIYLVADVLGHKDVNTTKKHYASLEDSRRRMAAKAVILREKQ